MIIVGTHLDKLPVAEAPQLMEEYRTMINNLYREPDKGYPRISDMVEVSAKSKNKDGKSPTLKPLF